MVNWPAIIKHTNDDELIYVSDQTEWDNDVDLHYFGYEKTDYLVDSLGKIYTLTEKDSFYVHPEPNGDSKSLQEVLDIIKAHASQLGNCCVAKLTAPSIKEAIKIIALLNDE